MIALVMTTAFLLGADLQAADLVQADRIVLARLRDVGTQPPKCGTSQFAAVMKYDVLKVVSGSLDGALVYAAHGCPELSREDYGGKKAGTVEKFKIGDVHKLFLSLGRPDARSVGVVDAFETEKGTRYWVVRAEKAKADSK